MLGLRQIDLLLHILVIDCLYSCICMCKQKNLTQYFCQFFKNISQALIFFFVLPVSEGKYCSDLQLDPVCDTDNRQHPNLCSLQFNGKSLAYKGFCKVNNCVKKKNKTEKCAKIPLLFKVIVSCWFKLFGTLPAMFGVIFNSVRGKYCTWWSACSFMIDFFLFDRMNVSPRPLPCAEWMVRLTPVHVQQTQPELLLITAVAAGQLESEMVSIYVYDTTVQDS